MLIPAILGAVIGAGVAARTTPQYRSDARILVVPQRVPESYVRSSVTTNPRERVQSISQQVLSRTNLERIIQDFDLYKEERRTGIMDDIVDRMRKNIEVNVEDGGTIAVGFIGTDPRTVMKVTDRVTSLFIEENLRDREVLAEGTDQFLEAQMEDARRRLVATNERMRTAKEKGLPEAETLAIEYEVQQATFKDLLAKKEESRMSANLERRQIGEQFKLIDPARLPERPIAPDWRQYVGIGAGAGAAIALLVLLLGSANSSRKRLETPDAAAPASDASPSAAPTSSS
jgi:uncharacterized protein involved in exopolysaccharide biosynthesis